MTWTIRNICRHGNAGTSAGLARTDDYLKNIVCCIQASRQNNSINSHGVRVVPRLYTVRSGPGFQVELETSFAAQAQKT